METFELGERVGRSDGRKDELTPWKEMCCLEGRPRKHLFSPSVLTFWISELDPFLQHVNKELKEKEIQAVATNSKTTHQLKVSVAWLVVTNEVKLQVKQWSWVLAVSSNI